MGPSSVRGITGDPVGVGTTVPVPPPVVTNPNAVPVAPQAAYTDAYQAQGIVPSARVNAPMTQQNAELGAANAHIHGESTRAPSFFQTVLEVLEFVGRWVFPIVSLISAAVRVARLLFEVVSGTNKEHIDWTQELIRLGGDLLGLIPGFGGPLSAIANTGLNWWYGTESKDATGAQILGGANYFFGPDWRGKQDSFGYYTSKVWDGVSSMTGNMFASLGPGGLSFGMAPATAAPVATQYYGQPPQYAAQLPAAAAPQVAYAPQQPPQYPLAAYAAQPGVAPQGAPQAAGQPTAAPVQNPAAGQPFAISS